MPIEALALQETSPLVASGVPEEVKQIASWDVSRQEAAPVNAEASSETNVAKIETEFLEILQEQVESHGIDDGAQESEWHLFLKNLLPLTPIECNDMDENVPRQDEDPNCEDPSLGEWESLLDRLSQLETSVVQQILRHIESDVLQGMVRFMHLRITRDTPGGTRCEESIALPNEEVPLSNPPNEPVQEEPETMQSIPELDSNTESVTEEFPILEKHGMDWLRWPQGSKSQPIQPTCSFRTDIREQANWDPLAYLSHRVESKLEGTLQVFQQQVVPQSLQILERGKSGIFDQPEQNMDLEPESQVAVLQGFKQVPQGLLPKRPPQGEPDEEEVNVEHTESESEPEQDSDKLDTGPQHLTNSDSCRICSQRIESKLAELPSQIASTLFMRTPLIMDPNLLHQLFRQIDQILFQVMPKQMLFNAVHPKQNKAHVHWHVPPDCSLRRHLDDGVEYSEVNQLEVFNTQHRHQFQSGTKVRENLQQTPQVSEEFTNGLGRTQLYQMPCQGNQSLNCQDVDSNSAVYKRSPCLWSAMFEYSAEVPNHLQLLPDLILDSSIRENLRCPKLDAMSFISSRMGGETTWNPQLIVTRPPSSTYPFLLDNLPRPETTDNLSLPQADSDQNISQLLPIADEQISVIFQGMDSIHHICLGLPQENQQVQKHMPSQTDTDFANLLPQASVESPFTQIDPVELHALRQNMCLTVLQQIAKQVEYNISQGLPLEINAGLLEALDLQPEDYWLQPSGQIMEPNHDYFQHYPDESWDLQEVDTDSEASPQTSQQTENFNDFRESHEGMMRQTTVESSTSGWTSDPSETDSPLYYMADQARKVYHRRYSYMDGHVDSLGMPIPRGKFFDEFEELHGSALETGMPLYTPASDIFDDVRQYMDMANTAEDELEDGLERSPDYMSSLNLLWVPEQELQQQSQVTQEEADDEIGYAIDFYLEGLADTASDLIWFLDPDESLKSAAALEEQEDVVANDLPYDLGVSGDLQVDEDLSGSSAEHMLDSNEAEELLLQGTDSSSRSSQAQEASEISTTSWDKAEQLQANAQLEHVRCHCSQPQLLDAAGLQDSRRVQSVRLDQRRKSVEWNPQIASVYSINELGESESNPGPNPDQHIDGSQTPNPAQGTRNEHHSLGSGISEGPQMNARSSERQSSSTGRGSGKPLQISTNSRAEERVEDQDASAPDSPAVSSSVVKLTNCSTSQRPPTVSQFRETSTSVRRTIFGLMVVAGGLYLVENRDEIEQQSISAAEAAAEAWSWLGSFLIRMAKGEFDN